MSAPPTIESLQREVALLRAGYGDLLQAISHDLRAPVRHIRSFTPVLQETLARSRMSADDAADAQFSMQAIEEAAAKLGGMTEALVRLCGVSAAKWEVQPVDLKPLLQQEVAAWQQRCPQVAVSWDISLEEAWLPADAGAVALLLQALLDNVGKFTAAVPAPAVHIRLHSAGAGRCCVALQDNGVGFSNQQPESLGKMFRRMHRDAEFPGVGSGLALARTIAERMGGELALTSEAKKGCLVRLSLPLIKDKAAGV